MYKFVPFLYLGHWPWLDYRWLTSNEQISYFIIFLFFLLRFNLYGVSSVDVYSFCELILSEEGFLYINKAIESNSQLDPIILIYYCLSHVWKYLDMIDYDHYCSTFI